MSIFKWFSKENRAARKIRKIYSKSAGANLAYVRSNLILKEYDFATRCKIMGLTGLTIDSGRSVTVFEAYSNEE